VTPAATYSPRAYRQGAVLTAPPEQLIVMLYDGARRFLFQAGTAMDDNQLELANAKLRQAEDIIAHLRETLDLQEGGPIAGQLQSIYIFCQAHLRQARFERSAAKIQQVSMLLGRLREAWAAIEVS
jgi:flagellar protein FliS